MKINVNLGDSAAALLCMGIVGYVGRQLAKRLNSKEVEESVLFDVYQKAQAETNNPQEFLCNRVVRVASEHGGTYDDDGTCKSRVVYKITTRVPIKNETAVAIIGGIFGSAVGFGIFHCLLSVFSQKSAIPREPFYMPPP